jgi:CDP-4-dehydro-6-deoxyglucose reductase, E3
MLVRIPSGTQFDATREESILDAAHRANVTLPYSCKTGRCSTCKGRVAQGHTVALHDELGLTAEEKLAGWILTCVRTADSDVEIEIEDLGAMLMHPERTLACRIESMSRLAPDVLGVRLRLPPNAELAFHPGQYIDVIGHGGLRRSYSVANAPAADRHIELHIRQVAGGAMSEYWFERAQPNDLLRLHGPLGTFFLRDVGGRDLVLLATGTGIAPIKAMLESLARDHSAATPPATVTVYWGGRQLEDLYWNPEEAGGRVKFVPVLSRATAAWEGVRGHVQEAALAGGHDLTNAVVLACGSDAMIHGSRETLLAAGVDSRRFHSDAFVCSASA